MTTAFKLRRCPLPAERLREQLEQSCHAPASMRALGDEAKVAAESTALQLTANLEQVEKELADARGFTQPSSAVRARETASVGSVREDSQAGSMCRWGAKADRAGTRGMICIDGAREI